MMTRLAKYTLRKPAGIAAVLLAALVTVPDAVVRAETQVHTGIDEQARLPFWEIRDRGVQIRLVQRLPDQTRAFFQARGFKPTDAEIIAQNCVFQTIFKNVSDQEQPSPLSYDLKEWVIHVNDQTQSMKMREYWREYWRSKQIPVPQQLAFNWALLPTEQSYESGDYNWGMSIFGLKPGTRFDLSMVWHQYGERKTVRVENIQCAEDIHLQPQRQ